MRGKNTKAIMKNNLKHTTVGLVYNIYADAQGNYILDDFGDVLYINIDCFEIA
ncbi:hypothetical protein [Bacillus subtilis]|uniref:hypothetical protein n=1 Tax=Bacillus subtilis TaxID=1423 RepID=UPI0013C2A18D|nr:hypothetical protein [Bacillus subtilis]MBU8716490.1 hypothetical protein [Bacillus subtilis]